MSVTKLFFIWLKSVYTFEYYLKELISALAELLEVVCIKYFSFKYIENQFTWEKICVKEESHGFHKQAN